MDRIESYPLFNDLKDDVDKTQPFIMGVDEAGRGPVLGPLVYGSCYAPISLHDKIIKMKFNDSKKLTEHQRELLFQKIINANDTIAFVTDINDASFLSEKMLARNQISLDILSHESAFRMVQSVLDKGVNLQELYLDTVGPPAKYQAKLRAAFPTIGKIVVSKKADSLYPIVSASSICAKVLRDHIISSISFKDYESVDISTDFGSGYPGDPATKKWLISQRDKTFGYPSSIARFSWKTATNNMLGECYSVDWTTPKTSIYFSNKRKRSTYFQDNQMDNQIVDF